MFDISKKITEERKRANLTIAEVSEKTKIRSHIIEDIEKGKLDVLPSVYMKAFLKTYCHFLNIPLSEIPENLSKQDEKTSESENISEKPDSEKKEHKKIKKSDQPKITFAEEPEEEVQDFKELFKRKPVQKNPVNFMNIIIYSVIGLAVVTTVFFTFFYSSDDNSEKDDAQISETTLTITDSSDKKKDSKNLFNYFNKSDSLELVAEAKGESWIRIEIDGQKIDEVLLQPGMKKRWAAKDFFLLTQGNVGSVVFKRNGEVLEPFGNAGTVAKNIKITANEVLNTNPINSNQNRTKVSRKKQDKKKPKRIEPSPIPKSKFLERKDKDPNGL